MSIALNNLKMREITQQLVNDPAYHKVAAVPLISWPQIGLILFSWLSVTGSIALHLLANIPIWYFYPLMIFAFYSAFTPLHDATHRAVSSNKRLNDLLGTISANLLIPFATTEFFRFLHLSHHRYAGDKAWDPDEPMVVIPTKYFPVGYLVLLIPDMLWGYWIYTKGWKRAPVRIRIWNTVIFVGILALNIIMFLSPYWFEYVVLYFIPNRLGTALIGYGFAHIQHPDGVKWSEHPCKPVSN